MRFIFKIFPLFIITCLVLFINISPAVAQGGCSKTGVGGTLLCQASGLTQVQDLITRIINISVTLAFMALTVWLVWNAVRLFVTSGGDPKALAHAWASVTWAFMGIFFMGLAYLVLKLILDVSGADVTNYCLGFPPYCL